MYLLDTHVWLWWLESPDRLKKKVIEILRKSDSRIFLSSGSVWEIAVKYSAGKLKLPEPPALYIRKQTKLDNLEELPINNEHAVLSAVLPPHHRDPFDRILVAQAIHEDLILITADEMLLKYDAKCLIATG